jgi:hypothetical protein
MAAEITFYRPMSAHKLDRMDDTGAFDAEPGLARYRLDTSFLAHLVAQQEGVALHRMRRRGTSADAGRAYGATAQRLAHRAPAGLTRRLDA